MGVECELIFDGVSSRDIGVTVEGFPGAVMPERDVEQENIPGRNGALIYDYGTYQNYSQTYTIHWRYIGHDGRISEWLHKRGYKRLEDSFHPEHYRMAYVSPSQDVDNRLQVLKRADIEFNCKPQWYRKNGDIPIVVNTSGRVLINTGEDALPLITVTGSGLGTVTAGTSTISISSIPSAGIVLDCELQDAYSVDKLTNYNSLITVTNNVFPKLTRGKNNIAFTGGVKSVKIVPRWWDLL